MVADRKAARRTAILTARRSLPAEVHAAEAEQLCRRVEAAVRGARTVCAYLPVGAEPGSPALLDRLLELCDVVLLPVVHIGPDGEPDALQWGSYTPGRLVRARWGLYEPPEPRLPADAIAEADVVLVPALAVDRAGVRLGRGGGFYDRSLALCRPGTALIAVVRDDEVVDELPSEAHDVLMTHALTPGSGVVPLGGRATDGGSST
jgi:5-formyltetrahydrofolate cyclo-ligase